MKVRFLSFSLDLRVCFERQCWQHCSNIISDISWFQSMSSFEILDFRVLMNLEHEHSTIEVHFGLGSLFRNQTAAILNIFGCWPINSYILRTQPAKRTVPIFDPIAGSFGRFKGLNSKCHGLISRMDICNWISRWVWELVSKSDVARVAATQVWILVDAIRWIDLTILM